MKEKSAITSFLAGTGWLSFTDPAFRDAVLARIEPRGFEKGEPVYRAGDAPGGLWALIEGAIEIESAAAGAAPHLMHFAVPGFWFGEGPLIAGVTRIVSVNASRPSTLATLPLADCRAILDTEPAYWRWIALLSGMTSDLAGGVVADLLLRDPVTRTAALLLRLAGVRSRAFPSDRPAPIYLSQEKIAHLVNLSRNSIIPVLHEFERNGHIEISYGVIRVLSIAGLNEVIAREG